MLDANRSTRHHGLVDRVYRDRNRITSPHRKPLSVDKHGRQISFLSSLMSVMSSCNYIKSNNDFATSNTVLFYHMNALNVPRLWVSSCVFLTCNFTLTAVHMAPYICHHHLIPAGGGKAASEDASVFAWLYISMFTLMVIIKPPHRLDGQDIRHWNVTQDV